MSAAEDLYRYVDLATAAKRLGIRRKSAVAWLESLGVVRVVGGRRRVWLADLRPERLAELEAAQKKKPARRPAAANTTFIPSDDDLAP